MSVGAKYVAEEINSLILQPVLRRFYRLIFVPSRKSSQRFPNDHKRYSSHL